MTSLARIIEADRLVQMALKKIEPILARNWDSIEKTMREHGATEEEVQAEKEITDKRVQENRIKLANEVWAYALATLPLGES